MPKDMLGKILLIILFLCVVRLPDSCGGESVKIQGLDIPVMEGSSRVVSGKEQGLTKYTYDTESPLKEVITFYERFLHDTRCIIIGGVRPEGSFDAAVKKDAAQFYVRIVREKGKTRVEFVW